MYRYGGDAGRLETEYFLKNCNKRWNIERNAIKCNKTKPTEGTEKTKLLFYIQTLIRLK